MKRMILLALFIVSPRVVLAGVEPSVIEVQNEAIRYARLNPDEVRSWRRDARLAPWLPRFQVGYDRNVDSKVNVTIDESASISSKGVVVGPKLSKTDSNSDRGDSVDVRAVWYLDELVFNRDQIGVNQEMREVIRETQVIAREVNRLYFDRQEALRHGDKQAAARLTGELDAFTGGWFSQELEGRER